MCVESLYERCCGYFRVCSYLFLGLSWLRDRAPAMVSYFSVLTLLPGLSWLRKRARDHFRCFRMFVLVHESLVAWTYRRGLSVSSDFWLLAIE